MMPISVPLAVRFAKEVPGWLPRWNHPGVRARFGSEAARRLLMQNALDDLDRVFYLGDRCVHQHRGRAVSQIKLGEAGGKTRHRLRQTQLGPPAFGAAMDRLKSAARRFKAFPSANGKA